MKTNPVATGESTKLQRRFKGPMVISEILPSDTYRITSLDESRRAKATTTAHVSQLKVWRGQPSSDEESDQGSNESSQNNESDVEHTQERGLLNDDNSCELVESEHVDDVVVNSVGTPTDDPSNVRTKRVRQRPKRFDDYVCV